MENIRGNGSETKAVPTLETMPDESQSDVGHLLPAGLVPEANVSTRWITPQALLLALILIAWELFVDHIYLKLHGMSLYGILFNSDQIRVLQFVTADKTFGPAVEIVAWSGTAVIVRRLVKLARDARDAHVYLRRDLLDAIADYAESIFLTFMLMALLSVPKITLGTGIDLSLKEASIDVVIALASILGWSVRETRQLLGRIFRLLFVGHGFQNGGISAV